MFEEEERKEGDNSQSILSLKPKFDKYDKYKRSKIGIT